MLFSVHVGKFNGFLLIAKSGLFHMGVNLDGEKAFVILWSFYQLLASLSSIYSNKLMLYAFLP